MVGEEKRKPNEEIKKRVMVEPAFVYTNALVRNSSQIPLIIQASLGVVPLSPSTFQITIGLIAPQRPPVAGDVVLLRNRSTGILITGGPYFVTTVTGGPSPNPYYVTLNAAPPFVGPVTAYIYTPGLTDLAIPFRYVEQRNAPLLLSAGDYDVCVEQFRFPTWLIPLMVCAPINPATGLGGRLLGYISMGLYSGAFIAGVFTTTVQVVPDNIAVVPTGVFYPSTVIRALNTALASIWALNGSPGGVPPVFVLDEVSGLISLYAPQGYYFPDQPAGGYAIELSGGLYKLLNSLPAFSGAVSNSVPANIYYPQILTVENLGTNAFVSTGPHMTGGGLAAGNYWQMQQTSVSLNEWDDFSSIVITSSLPTNAELLPGVSDTEFLGPILTSYIVNGGNAQRNTLYEWLYQRPIATSTAFREPAVYTASGSGSEGGRRFIQLLSNQPLQQQSYYAFWQDKRFNLFPLLLGVDDYGMIKTCFRKRNAQPGQASLGLA